MLIQVTLRDSHVEDHASATVGLWIIEEGEDVVKDDELVEMNCGEREFKIKAPVTGTVQRILVEDGDDVEVGEVLCIIEEG